MTGVASMFLAACCLPATLDMQVVPLFTPLEYRYTGGRYQDELFPYRLFVPAPIKPGKKYPLLLWLHGKGESGTNNTDQLFYMQHVLTDPSDRSKYPFFVLAPQCPKDRDWSDGHRIPSAKDEPQGEDEPMTIAMKILDETIRKYPIDTDRIYLLGISSGGSAVWELAMRYPGRFAAVAPIASGGGNTADIGRLRDVPVWAFHSEFDESTQVAGVRDTVKALRQAGGTTHLTTVPTRSHDCWCAALIDYEVVSWMRWQRRGGRCWYPPGFRPWNPGQIAAQAVIPAVIGIALWSAWRKRRKRARSSNVTSETPADEIAED